MAIRMTGLNSGLDTDAIVQALMSAKRTKQTKIKSKQTKLEWKKEIWAGLNTKLYNFYTSSLGKIKSQGSFKTKSANSSDSSKVTATATSAAEEGTYKIKVNSLASAQYVTSSKLNGAKDKDGNKVDVTSKTKLVDLLDSSGNTTFTAGTQISIKGKSGLSTLLIDENTTVNDFVKAASNAGLTASFDEKQQRFFINSATSGADQGFTITAGTLDANQLNSINSLKEAVGYSYLSATDKAAVSKIFDQLQDGTIDTTKAEGSLKKYLEKSQKSAVTAYYNQKQTDYYNNQYFTFDANGKKNGVTAAGEQAWIAKTGKTQADWDKLSASDQQKELTKLVTDKVDADMKTATMKADILDGVTNGINDPNAGAFLQKDAATRSMALSTSIVTFKGQMSNGITAANNQLAGVGLEEVTGAAVAEKADGTGMVVVKASDSSITFNGATLSSSTSSISVSGLTLDVLGETAGSEVTISVTKDNSAIYDTVKDFLSDYNSILKQMNTYYNANSARGYDVLTDDQKTAMTDKEVELWETKIKDSLLRRDDTLSSLISCFRTNMAGTYTASNGKTYSLASIGISTSTDYREGGLLHIKGDEDDAEYMDETNKLQQMLNDDPDLVMEIITGLTTNLYSDLQEKMSSTTMSSALTFYNDKEMNSQISDYKKQVTTWEKKLLEIENRYYAQFTAMEKAMASLNSQQNYFSNMFG